jgi:hypothetical protein
MVWLGADFTAEVYPHSCGTAPDFLLKAKESKSPDFSSGILF